MANYDPPPYNPRGIDFLLGTLKPEYIEWEERQDAKRQKTQSNISNAIREIAALGETIQASSLNSNEKNELMNYVEKAKRILENENKLQVMNANIRSGYALEKAITRQNKTFKNKKLENAVKNYTGKFYIEPTLMSAKWNRQRSSYLKAESEKTQTRNNLRRNVQKNKQAHNYVKLLNNMKAKLK